MKTVLKFIVLTAILCIMAPAYAQTTPQTGEIEISGKVMASNRAQQKLLISARAVTQSDGTTVKLPKPRLKIVNITDQTHIVSATQSAKTLGNLTKGSSVSVIGNDSGVGKPLDARLVTIQGPVARVVHVHSVTVVQKKTVATKPAN